MVRLELAEGSVQEGDEEGITAAIVEAYVEAVKAASIHAAQGFEEWQRQAAAVPPPASRRDDGDDEQPDFVTETF